MWSTSRRPRISPLPPENWDDGAGRLVGLRPVGFEDLYRDAHPVLLRLAYLITRSTAVAEEIVADGFVAVLQRWPSLETPGAYLRTVVVRAAVRSRHRGWRERLMPNEELRPPSRDGEPELDATWELLATLPPRQRAVLVLRFYADCTHAEIAAVLRCPEATVRTLSRRGLAALRKEMEQWTR